MRDILLMAPELLTKSINQRIAYTNLHDLAWLLNYGTYHPSRGKVKTTVNVDTMVDRWTDYIVALSSSHSHEEYSRADYDSDDMLSPILTAPVAQLREFAAKLANRMREDERVPYLIWSSFEYMLTELLLKQEDSGLITLKLDLAKEVAEMVEREVPRQSWQEAIAGALKWRSQEQLQEVKAELEKGTKPVLRGRQSCLFLEVGKAMVVI